MKTKEKLPWIEGGNNWKWRRKSTYKFQFKIRNSEGIYIKKTINLEKYSFKEIADYTENAYDNLDELFLLNKEKSLFEIADCLWCFKYENGKAKKIIQ